LGKPSWIGAACLVLAIVDGLVEAKTTLAVRFEERLSSLSDWLDDTSGCY
jgi:hypothetical protein